MRESIQNDNEADEKSSPIRDSLSKLHINDPLLVDPFEGTFNEITGWEAEPQNESVAKLLNLGTAYQYITTCLSQSPKQPQSLLSGNLVGCVEPRSRRARPKTSKPTSEESANSALLDGEPNLASPILTMEPPKVVAEKRVERIELKPKPALLAEETYYSREEVEGVEDHTSSDSFESRQRISVYFAECRNKANQQDATDICTLACCASLLQGNEKQQANLTHDQAIFLRSKYRTTVSKARAKRLIPPPPTSTIYSQHIPGPLPLSSEKLQINTVVTGKRLSNANSDMEFIDVARPSQTFLESSSPEIRDFEWANIVPDMASYDPFTESNQTINQLTSAISLPIIQTDPITKNVTARSSTTTSATTQPGTLASSPSFVVSPTTSVCSQQHFGAFSDIRERHHEGRGKSRSGLPSRAGTAPVGQEQLWQPRTCTPIRIHSSRSSGSSASDSLNGQIGWKQARASTVLDKSKPRSATLDRFEVGVIVQKTKLRQSATDPPEKHKERKSEVMSDSPPDWAEFDTQRFRQAMEMVRRGK